jgi:hypothetical protein
MEEKDWMTAKLLVSKMLISSCFVLKRRLGNIFLFLFAGHETTAHALSFCLGLLALYPEVQREVYMQIEEVIRLHGKLVSTGKTSIRNSSTVTSENRITQT